MAPSGYASKASPLPPLSSEDPLTQDQWRNLLAFADTVVPAVVPDRSAVGANELPLATAEYAATLSKINSLAAGSSDASLAESYLLERASDLQPFKDNIYRLLSCYVPTDLKQQLALGLTLLNYRIGALILTGKPTVFADQPLVVREQIVKSWAHAKIPIVRLLFKSLTLMVKQTWAKSSTNLRQVIGFPQIPIHGEPQKGFDFSFIQIPPATEPEVLETDVVIVGSGCGGAVVAKNLAEAGFNVIVVDKAYHWTTEHLPMTETEGWAQMFHNGGFLFSEDSSTCVIAGQTWGGGGSVNWSASLQTQGYVRKEWSDAGLPFFTSSEFQDCLDVVCNRMGVSTDHITHNKSNDVLLEGARKLGWTAKAVPQNTGGTNHYCGYCTMGCGSCGKQGPTVSFLPDAAKAGARFIEGLDVAKVIFSTDKATGKKTAVGVQGLWRSRDEYGGVHGETRTRPIVIKSKRVVISAGTMHSPTILMRSGLKNRHIGKNLKLHPVVCVGGIYDEEVRPWEGGILTAVVTSFENLDGQGHGTKLEACTMLPSTWLTFPVWRGGADWKTLAPRFRNMAGHISLARDVGSGSIYIDPVDGRTRFRYNPIKKDRQHILEGMVALAKINYIAGAREIFTPLAGVPNFVRAETQKPECETAGINCPTFNAWLDKVRKFGLPDPDTTFMSAHQMGSVRMGASPKQGAIDMYGRTWEADGLYVADASTFPSASGVNPMITNMAISEWVSRNVIRDLKSGGAVRTKL